MASLPCDLNLKIITMNVRGIRNAKKRRSLFRIFKQSRYDIISLQETHITCQDIKSIENEWGNIFHISEGSTNSKGLLTLFGHSIKADNVNLASKSDRSLISTVSIDNVNLSIANFYGPCDNAEKRTFLEKFQTDNKNKNDFDIENVVALGDFNVVMDNNLDIISGQPHASCTVDLFNAKINDLLLFDIWRHSNGLIKEFTWSKNKPFTARRLDYIFITNDLIPFCMDAAIKTIGFSDHRAMTILLDFTTFKRGPGTFKFNTKLLHNTYFVDDVKQEIQNIANSNLDPHLSWEYIKIQIKSLGILYGRALGTERFNEKRSLFNQLDEIKKSLSRDPNCENTSQKYIEINIRQKLELIIMAETEGARIRSGQKWAEEGEKCTKYFLNLEKQRSKANTIFILNNHNTNKCIKKSDEILSEIANHFENIYKTSDEILSKESLYDEQFLFEQNLVSITQKEIPHLRGDISEKDVYLL